jgi:hypothetical protein
LNQSTSQSDGQRRAQRLTHIALALIFVKYLGSGDQKLNMSFVAFDMCLAALNVTEEALDFGSLESDDAGESREERVFRMWISSLNFPEFSVNNFFEDLHDGTDILKLEGISQPQGVVNCVWKKEESLPFLYSSLSSLPFCRGHFFGKDTQLLLAVIWRSMRKSLLLVLAQFAARDHGGLSEVSEGHVIAGTCCGRTFSSRNFEDQYLKNESRAVNWELVTMAGESDEGHKEPKSSPTRTQTNQPTSLSTMATPSTTNSTQATIRPPSCSLFHFFSYCRSVVVMSFFFVMLMTSLPQIHAIASPATRSSLKSTAAHSDIQHNHPSPSPVPTISSTTCPNGLEDGNYLFRSYSEQSWIFCGVSGAGYRELSFQISDCECHAGVYGEVCADDITFSSVAVAPSIMPPFVEQSPNTNNIF